MAFLGTAAPHGGNVVVCIGLLLKYVPTTAVLVKDEYSDAVAAAVITPQAFAALLHSEAHMSKHT